MELSYGSRDLRFSSEDGEQEDHHIPLRHSSSSSSSSSNTGIRWGAAGDGPSAPPSPALAFVEKEHMFHKVVTPSDVGKLNRLVIPKQHAERYFPLDASSSDKGLLLSFEDRSGKPWRFRYSYWNSSQSYVMTKGWSRFVKEKRLDAGDTVSFGRGVGEAGRDRLFIDWKRRPDSVLDPPRLPRLPIPSGGGHHNYQHHSLLSFAQSPPPLGSWGGRFSLPTVTLHDNHHQPLFQTYHQNAVGINTIGSSSGNQDAKLVYFHPPPRAALQPVLDSVPVIHHQATPKRVRLFGVNLDCPESGSGVGNLLPQHTQYRPIPPLEMRLGSEVDSAAARWSPEEQQSHLDLDL